MWSFPSLNDVCKRYLDLALAEWKPAKLGAHGLLLELGRSPDERRARDAKRHGCPATAHREGRCHDQDAESHQVGPAHVAEEPLAMDHERETKPDHKQAAETGDETVRIHRKSRSGVYSRSRVSALRPSWPLPAQWPCRADRASTGHTWLPDFGRTLASSCGAGLQDSPVHAPAGRVAPGDTAPARPIGESCPGCRSRPRQACCGLTSPPIP